MTTHTSLRPVLRLLSIFEGGCLKARGGGVKFPLESLTPLVMTRTKQSHLWIFLTSPPRISSDFPSPTVSIEREVGILQVPRMGRALNYSKSRTSIEASRTSRMRAQLCIFLTYFHIVFHVFFHIFTFFIFSTYFSIFSTLFLIFFLVPRAVGIFPSPKTEEGP